MIEIDHLVVGAATLEEGVDWCRRTLGVEPAPGGRHALFGTHNRLLRIATPQHPDAYLEIIAVDPQAPPPARTRWFGLDEAATQTRLRQQGPQLLHWVARTTNLDGHAAALRRLGLEPGAVVRAGRETAQGPLRWRLLVPDDGGLLLQGRLPTLIQWDGPHPCTQLPDQGVTLQRLEIGGLPPEVVEALGPRAMHVCATRGLVASLQSPAGWRQIQALLP
jgi:hypothetical protein